MKKSIATCFFTLFSCFTTAANQVDYNNTPTHYASSSQATTYTPLPPLGMSIALEYPTFKAKQNDFKETSIDLEGFAISLSSNPHLTGIYGKFEIQKNNGLEVNFYEVDFGGQLNLLNYQGFYALATVGIGYSWIKNDYLYNDLNYFAIPLGLELGYTLMPNMSIYGGVGYKWLIDITSDATCRDGTESYRSGRDGCYWNGGVAYYNDNIGDLSGLTTKLGMRFNF